MMMTAPRRSIALLLAPCVLLCALLCAGDAVAKPRGLKAALAPSNVILDGLPKELTGEWRDVSYVLKGDGPDDDVGGRVIIVYDDEAIYVGADVRDDKLVGGGDHVELLLGIPGGTVQSFLLYPGVPGKSRAAVKTRGGPVSGAEIVEAPSPRGYTLEAKIPWRSIPKSSTIRVGYRGALFVHDADRSRSVEAIIGTADSRKYRSLPPISTESELALGTGLLRQRNLTQAPRFNLMANVVGDKLKERVMVYGRFLVVLGPGYRDGQQYYFRDLHANADRGGLPELKLRDYTGDGKPDILLRRVVKGSKGKVEVFEILSYHSGGDTPESVFAQEVRLDLAGGSIVNQVSLSGSGSGTQIVLEAGKAKGLDISRFQRESNTGATPVLLPWGTVASQTFRMRGDRFAMINEETKAADRPPPAAPTPLETGSDAPSPHPRPRPRSKEPPGADVSRVYGLYKKQRNVRGRPRFDVRANFAEDKRKERLVVHGRDLVVFGNGYKGGRGFAAVTLAQFDKPSDIKSVKSRDVNGDGRHEIIIRGIIRSPLPDDIGSGDMVRTVVMIYALRRSHFDRVFAAEVGRAVGGKRVVAKLRFIDKGKWRIELKPGKAHGYGERTYPWTQKKVPDGGFEPLLLPWGGVDRVRIRYDGSAFVR